MNSVSSKKEQNNPDIKIQIKELEEMKKNGNIDLKTVKEFLESNFDLKKASKEVQSYWKQ